MSHAFLFSSAISCSKHCPNAVLDDSIDQFRIDVKVNPLDVEEIVWDIASLSRLNPSEVPPATIMSLPKGRTDRRKIMVRTDGDLVGNKWDCTYA